MGDDGRVAEAARLLDALAIYAPERAHDVRSQLAHDLDAALLRASQALAHHTREVIEERETDLEDWDSSSNIHLLHELERRARALSQ